MNLTVGEGLGMERTGVPETVLVCTPHIAERRGGCVELGIRRDATIGSQLKQTLDVEEKRILIVLQLLSQLLHPCSIARLC